MVQWTSYLFIKGMTLWNTLTDWFSSIIYYTMDFSNYIINYFHTDHSTWYFLPFHHLPLSHTHIKNKITPQWKYSASRRILEQSNPSCMLTTYSIDWLSASLSIENDEDKNTYEYSMDDFLEHVRIRSDGCTLPTLNHLFLIWCIHTHHWFSGRIMVYFKVIDSNGEFHSYLSDDYSLSFHIHHNKLQIKKKSEHSIS